MQQRELAIFDVFMNACFKSFSMLFNSSNHSAEEEDNQTSNRQKTSPCRLVTITGLSVRRLKTKELEADQSGVTKYLQRVKKE